MDCVDGKRVISPTLVGRAEELERLASAVIAPPAVVVVEGEAGVGKTRLVTELAARPGVGDRRFVVGTCRRMGEPLPLGPVIEAVRGLDDELRRAQLSPVAGALRPLLPELAHILPEAPEPLEDKAAERHRVFRGLVAVLDALGPAVLVLEDLHWADGQTVDFVSYLLGDLPLRLALVLTYRQEDVDSDVRALTAKLPESFNRAHVVLGPLDEVETGELASAILGTDRLSEEFTAHLCERTGGLPFAIEELLALLRVRGTLVRRGGGWARRTLDELGVPSGIRDSVLQRVSHLSANAQQVVEAAAVLQTPMPTGVLTATCGLANAPARPGLEEALESRVLAENGSGIGFRHMLAAQAVYDSIPGPRRQDLHSRAASALGTVDPMPLGQVAHHLRHGGRLDEWVEAAEQAADQAITLGHDEEAARVLEDVLRHAPLVSDLRGRLGVKLARTAIDGQRAGEVVELLAALVERYGRALRREVRGELRLLLALLLERCGGDPVRRRRLYGQAVDDLSDRPDLQARAMVGLGLGTVPGMPLSERTIWLDRVLDVAPIVDDPALRSFLIGKVAMGRAATGDSTWKRLVNQMREQIEGRPPQRLALRALLSVGRVACSTGHHEIADRLLTAALEGAVASESIYIEWRVRSAFAVLDYCRGRWEGLADDAEVIIDKLADDVPARRDVEVVAACLALAHGDVAAARKRLTEVVEQLPGPAGFDLQPLAAPGLVRLAVASGELDKIEPIVNAVTSEIECTEFKPLVGRALPTVAEGLMATGQMTRARRLVGRYDGVMRDLDAPLGSAGVRHARGLLGAAAQRWRPAARHFLAAAELYGIPRCVYEAAQAREQAAVSLFGAGDGRGEEALTAALAGYQQLGATWDFDRAASLAREHGVAVPVRHRGGQRGYGDELSPREQEVAELAAAGRTNKEIARELFVSVNTVNKQLSAARRKLGVRSRAALASRLADAGATTASKNRQFVP